MKYRSLGKTGIMAGEIGMGCEGFLDKPYDYIKDYIDLMDRHGANFIDMYLAGPVMREYVGKALKGRRDRFYIQGHLCSIWENGDYLRTRDFNKVKAGFEDLLLRMDTDYIDIGMLHYADSLDDFNGMINGEIGRYALKLKEEGRIRHIGLSTHNPKVGLAAAACGMIEVIMFSVNPCFDLQPAFEDLEELKKPSNYDKPMLNIDPERERFYLECEKRGIGITAMKPFGGGRVLRDEDSLAGIAITPYQCISYALDRPAVCSVICGARNLEELENCLAFEESAAAEKDYSKVMASMRKLDWNGVCMYCGHCAPCPRGIKVAEIIKLYDMAKTNETVPETLRDHYRLLERHAEDCVCCGACERRCPFSVDVLFALKKVQDLFGY